MVDTQCVHLTTLSRQREHQQALGTVAERLGRDVLGELRRRFSDAPESDQLGGERLDPEAPQLLVANDGGRCPGLGGELVEHRSSPGRERAFEGESASSPTAGSVADRCIDLLCEQRHISGDVDPVADRIGLQRVGTDQAPHARHRRTKRTRLHPEAILDLRGPKGDARIDRQQGDQAALTRARQCMTHSADVDERDRTQHRHVRTRGIFRPTCSG